ncbi:MAG TPA: helix-turn-helix transcriptional regulator [Opitutaceae bacterium]|nr:helix-turn-helix transcriptional regulator [Opitutaceae bacterium]
MPKRPKANGGADVALKARFGSLVRSFRGRLAISQEELAWRADMHRTYLADIERGRRNLSLSRIARLVKALGVSLTEFFFAFEEYFQSPIETPLRGGRSRSSKPTLHPTPKNPLPRLHGRREKSAAAIARRRD